MLCQRLVQRRAVQEEAEILIEDGGEERADNLHFRSENDNPGAVLL
jgi:hypothetical protein